MIRYRFQGHLELLDVGNYNIPQTKHLKGLGPWKWEHTLSGHTVATHGSAGEHEWTDWRKGMGDYEVSHADPLPEWDYDKWRNNTQGEMLSLTQGIVAVRPLSFEGRSVDWDGTLGKPTTEYGRICVELLELIDEHGDLPVNDQRVLYLARRSIMECMNLTAEAVHIWGFLNEDDIPLILGAIADCPKA